MNTATVLGREGRGDWVGRGGLGGGVLVQQAGGR